MVIHAGMFGGLPARGKVSRPCQVAPSASRTVCLPHRRPRLPLPSATLGVLAWTPELAPSHLIGAPTDLVPVLLTYVFIDQDDLWVQGVQTVVTRTRDPSGPSVVTGHEVVLVPTTDPLESAPIDIHGTPRLRYGHAHDPRGVVVVDIDVHDFGRLACGFRRVVGQQLEDTPRQVAAPRDELVVVRRWRNGVIAPRAGGEAGSLAVGRSWWVLARRGEIAEARTACRALNPDLSTADATPKGPARVSAAMKVVGARLHRHRLKMTWNEALHKRRCVAR